MRNGEGERWRSSVWLTNSTPSTASTAPISAWSDLSAMRPAGSSAPRLIRNPVESCVMTLLCAFDVRFRIESNWNVFVFVTVRPIREILYRGDDPYCGRPISRAWKVGYNNHTSKRGHLISMRGRRTGWRGDGLEGPVVTGAASALKTGYEKRPGRTMVVGRLAHEQSTPRSAR